MRSKGRGRRRREGEERQRRVEGSTGGFADLQPEKGSRKGLRNPTKGSRCGASQTFNPTQGSRRGASRTLQRLKPLRSPLRQLLLSRSPFESPSEASFSKRPFEGPFESPFEALLPFEALPEALFRSLPFEASPSKPSAGPPLRGTSLLETFSAGPNPRDPHLSERELGNVLGEIVLNILLLNHWIMFCGKPNKMRTDPERAFRNQRFRRGLAAKGICLDFDPGDASWKTEWFVEAQDTMKHAAIRVACRTLDSVTIEEIFEDCTAAHNDLQRKAESLRGSCC